MDPDYLSLLMCPTTRSSLRVATDAEIERANRHCEGESIEAGLVNETGSLLYPIRDGIPVLLVAESIALDSAPGEPLKNE